MTERAEHTAGQWLLSLPIQTNWTYEVDYCDAKVFCPGNAYPWVMANIKGPDHRQTEAYARLIAAAPDLLAALQALSAEEWRDDDDPILDAAREKARKALSRATGEA